MDLNVYEYNQQTDSPKPEPGRMFVTAHGQHGGKELEGGDLDVHNCITDNTAIWFDGTVWAYVDHLTLYFQGWKRGFEHG